MAVASKAEADAYDRVIEAAADLAELIASSGIEIDEYDLEELTIYLARNSIRVREILSVVLRHRTIPRLDPAANQPAQE